MKRTTKSNDIVLIMSAFNAKVGEDHRSQTVGKFALGKQNERGKMLIYFAEKNNMVICSTWFKTHKRRLHAWISLDGRSRNQIDYILIDNRFKGALKNAIPTWELIVTLTIVY